MKSSMRSRISFFDIACMRVAPCLASSTFEGACTEKQMPLASMPSSSGVHLKT